MVMVASLHITYPSGEQLRTVEGPLNELSWQDRNPIEAYSASGGRTCIQTEDHSTGVPESLGWVQVQLREVILNKAKQSPTLKAVQERNTPVRPGAFVFCERVSGAMRFKVEAAPGGSLPVEKAASLLAMHCLVRGLTPCDYTVLVVPRGTLLDSVGQRAQELLDLGRAIGTGVRLSPREREVLECVLMNKSNKEIGSQLNICERTVKFHVSALLAKFNVRDRAGLAREATVGLLPKNDLPTETTFSFPVIAQQEHKNVPQGAGLSRVLRMTRNQSFA